MAMASNNQPPFVDVAGNCSRRFWIILFNICIAKSDSTLFKRCRANIGNITLKMSRCYQHATSKYGKMSLWNIKVPDAIIAAKNAYMGSCSNLAAYLASDDLVYDPDTEMPLKDFERALNQWLTSTIAFASRTTSKKYIEISITVDAPLFRMYQCEILGGKYQHTFVISGVQLARMTHK